MVADTSGGRLPGYVWVRDEGARVTRAGDARRCRMLRCGAWPVALEIAREHRQRDGTRKVYWWAYCELHGYGRRIKDGIVWLMVWADSPYAARADERREWVGREGG